jgi:ubiquinone/menaquinone biosynthesis C-methylase UbiE
MPSSGTRFTGLTMAENSIACAVCGQHRWLSLPLPHPTQSVRSDGSIVRAPLRKNHCAACGLVQTAAIPGDLALEQLYSHEYDLYKNRPGSEQFSLSRYSGLAAEITAAAGAPAPKRVLEVGCGNGSALAAVKAAWPVAHCIGLEPVPGAVAFARAKGLDVRQGMIGNYVPQEIATQAFDVIYAVHVIEHTRDPVEFLRALKSHLAPGGTIIVTCPDASTPNLEITRADHNYSMLPAHLVRMGQTAGLRAFESSQCTGGPEGTDLKFNQLVAFARASAFELTAGDVDDHSALFEARCGYLQRLARLETDLFQSLEQSEQVLCFGAGGWASVLAGYAPAFWERVTACVIDGGASGTVHGKPVIAYAQARAQSPRRMVVGTNPAIQAMLAERLRNDGLDPIRWDNLIPA